MKQQNDDLQNLSNTEGISTKFLYLMHIHDSAFPIGSYTHSFGMETFIQSDTIRTKEDLFQFCKMYLHENVAYTDGIFVKESYVTEDMSALIRLDKICDANKNAEETREASAMIGKQFVKAVLPVSETPSLEAWYQLLQDKQVMSHFPIVYGLYAKDLAFDLYTAVLTFLYSSTVGLVHNAVRAIPLGQKAGIEVIHRLIPEMEKATKQVLERSLADLSNHAVGLELASMQHKYLTSRLFIS
ncbi:urease accessory protein UreF [Gracilibacillus salinarum]|uniref:Urease accessory protein UreF n=1 Tax=Gracilibacillus salinarum TaxID=2932255 RepID=A0ABY4GL63_9BACI|nr:urease accessory protein UreF [Gracilibacillus salinarum]UOQ84964.1 urease accessory protein UreF [Gracilibacillus salinarum]